MAKNKTLKSKMEEIKKIDEKSINKKRIADEIKEESEKENKNKKENKQELELFSSNEPKEKINIVSLNMVKEKEELEEEKLTKEKVEKNKKREKERLAEEEKEKKKENAETDEEKHNEKIKEEKEKRKKKIIKKLKKDNNEEDELFNLNIEITRNKFGLDQEEFINERIKAAALDKLKKDDNISGKKTNKNAKKNIKKNKKNLKEDDMFSNHLIEDLEESEENNIEKILKEHNKSRLFGKNKKKKLIYKVAIELIVFMVVAILLLFTYFTVFKFKILTNKQLMFIPVIFAIASFFFLEIGFKEKEYMKFIRGLELIAFSYIYTYYLNVLEITFMYPINQKEIWFGIYGYFAIKLLIIGTSEKRKHNKTYLDIKDITK
ncbi:MAG: hypothetical protein HG467_001215 [Clostridiales bacterium]|nr:hypothetical protein [Clostridiales bacterium]